MLYKTLFGILSLFSFLTSVAQTDTILVKTDQGNFKVMLYDFIPKHRALLKKSVQEGVYSGAAFNRVIADFVVQGGELDESILTREANEPDKLPERLAPEFDERAFHKVGVLGAGRDDNPTKSSFLNQIYFVVGKKVSDADLNLLEDKKGIQYTDEQRAVYLEQGGQPRLDKDYTVFGEVVEGLDVLMEISKSPTDSKDNPLGKILFTMELLN